MALGSARCANHPDVAAVETCQRCGSFVCGDCLELIEGVPFCPACFQRQSGGGASRRAVASLILAIVGLNCGFLPGIVGLYLATRELRAIEAGDAAISGRATARAARVIGWIDVALLVISIVGLLIFRFRTIDVVTL